MRIGHVVVGLNGSTRVVLLDVRLLPIYQSTALSQIEGCVKLDVFWGVSYLALCEGKFGGMVDSVVAIGMDIQGEFYVGIVLVKH